MLQPVVTQTNGKYDVAISGLQGAGAAPRSATITVGVAPAVGAGQTATLEMLTGQQVAYTFRAQSRETPATQLTFAAVAVTAGDYLFRVRIDGAESPLELDANRTPIAPKGTIP